MKHTRSQCPCCKHTFANKKALVTHRVGSLTRKRRCLSPREMRMRGLTQGEQGSWIMPPLRVSPVAWQDDDLSEQAG